ncbi:MAG: glutamate formimidoyltransferase [Desulfobacteraceae bacterium]|nr:glutamate formimidoyltransferase [Desulfobacteraceae bacterium]
MKKIMQCVPNFSEGRDQQKIDKICAPFRDQANVKLLDVQSDADHNRMVVTAVGNPEDLKQAVLAAMGQAIKIIDMTKHKGQHPRMGAVDVVPFIPIQGVTMQDAVVMSKQLAAEASEAYNIPIFLYERSATAPHRTNLAAVRKGQFEGMAEKLNDPQWQPDFGPAQIHPTAGVTAMSARPPLVAFNVNLATDQLAVADAIAKKVRFLGGGLRYCKAMGVTLEDRGIVQVSMNMTDFTKSTLYQIVELIRIEAKRYGVSIVGSEVVGLVPMQAMVDAASYYMGLENFTMDQVLETHLL